MKDFDTWMSHSTQNARAEIEGRVREPTHFFIECRHCGKQAFISYSDLENGDSGWYVDEKEPIEEMEHVYGLCGGGPGCTP